MGRAAREKEQKKKRKREKKEEARDIKTEGNAQSFPGPLKLKDVVAFPISLARQTARPQIPRHEYRNVPPVLFLQTQQNCTPLSLSRHAYSQCRAETALRDSAFSMRGVAPMRRAYNNTGMNSSRFIVQELCESRGGRPGLSVLTSLLVSVDVKLY